MISINMTNTYNAMNRTISWWLTSEREKHHALLERKRNKDDVIPSALTSTMFWMKSCMHGCNWSNIVMFLFVLFVQMMMQTVLAWRSYFAPNVMHPNTQSKTNHALLIFFVWPSISFEHFLFTHFQEEHTSKLDQGMQVLEFYSLESLCHIYQDL